MSWGVLGYPGVSWGNKSDRSYIFKKIHSFNHSKGNDLTLRMPELSMLVVLSWSKRSAHLT